MAMEGEESEQIFLLEFLVDSVRIKRSASFSDRHIDSIPSQLTTIFQFLKFPPLEIKEKDQHNKGDEAPSFRIGKSCLFAIPSRKLVDYSKLFNLNVSVARRFPPGVLPEKTIIGETTVDISSDFAYVVTEVLTNPHAIPKSKAMRESYPLKNSGDNVQIGSIVLYLRISCFGKLIVNEFQLNTECTAVVPADLSKKDPDERSRKDDSDFTPFKLGTGEEVLVGHLKRSSSESSVASGDFAEDDYTEVGAKVEGRWITIRVPKEKLRTHAGDICKLDGGGGVVGSGGLGCGGGGAGGGGGSMDALSALPSRASRHLKGFERLGGRSFMHLLQRGGGVGEAASLPASRESGRRGGGGGGGGGGGSSLRVRPTSTPLEAAHGALGTPLGPADAKSSKGKSKSSKVKPAKADRKADKKSKKRPLV